MLHRCEPVKTFDYCINATKKNTIENGTWKTIKPLIMGIVWMVSLLNIIYLEKKNGLQNDPRWMHDI